MLPSRTSLYTLHFTHTRQHRCAKWWCKTKQQSVVVPLPTVTSTQNQFFEYLQHRNKPKNKQKTSTKKQKQLCFFKESEIRNPNKWSAVNPCLCKSVGNVQKQPNVSMWQTLASKQHHLCYGSASPSWPGPSKTRLTLVIRELKLQGKCAAQALFKDTLFIFFPFQRRSAGFITPIHSQGSVHNVLGKGSQASLSPHHSLPWLPFHLPFPTLKQLCLMQNVTLRELRALLCNSLCH